MPPQTESLPMHARKRYRVVLEGFDPARETEESFAVKLSMRMRTPMPRVRQVLRNLPRPLRDGLTSTQANRLKTVLESLGGRARVEMHIVVPGTSGSSGGGGRPSSPGHRRERRERKRRRCPECGWEEAADALYCGLCHHPFGSALEHAEAQGVLPTDNPLDVPERLSGEPGPPTASLGRSSRVIALSVAAAVILILLLLLK